MPRSFIPVVTFLGSIAVLAACGPTTTDTPVSPTPGATVTPSPDATLSPSPDATETPSPTPSP
ncbi:MAG TPA: hypothetical protein IGS53_13645 [Leptolyngbyaceae cyanobacterium M33_DOE_097]|uniref:Beta-Ig-H3/fasciclin n=1 Tax=Oscillatoriales cyanobacterium SpSt-418 TaxID=2282169 RepID=A0A7C3PKI7_9CYAN|nr:hypothetical protein [Leptolyngbyaceae cyanobacterium M33_DOE_097]